MNLITLYREFRDGKEYITTRQTDIVIYKDGVGLFKGERIGMQWKDYVKLMIDDNRYFEIGDKVIKSKKELQEFLKKIKRN